MNNTYYFIRHAHSAYSPDEAGRPLSETGRAALDQLDFLTEKPITAVYSSPYQRAIQTIEPLAQKLNLPIQIDERLVERKLSSQMITDQEFESCLKQLWSQPDFALAGGESNLAAQKRALGFLQELEAKHHQEHIVLSSHGNLICILLQYFDPQIDYYFWRRLAMPDVLMVGQKDTLSHPLKKDS
ncbi:histidine phosphatase family protein [Streptococcus panodentis]|uniref:Histidine phosphatase family protein n=1 Tax=Streptococcus panodentis TaxID=1581472 RepID=A0ABS5AZQ2_9STRE|nr:histidine phosphatase family protein [Streptococcus panodentis]MBP2622064.1 histidine phosphatase family protein [Streptococcus panodentis]